MNHLKWLFDSLGAHTQRCEELARHMRWLAENGSCREEPMKSSCVLLAAAHESAADMYKRQLEVVLRLWEAAKPVDASLAEETER